MIGEYYNPNLIGGAEIQAMRRAEGLARLGLNVTVVSFDGNGKNPIETINGVKVIRHHLFNHKAKMLSLVVPVAKALRKYENEADVYHLYNTHPLPAAGLYRMSGGKKPVIASLENYSGFCPVSTAMFGKCDLVCRYSCLKRPSRNAFEKIIAAIYALSYPFLKFLAKRAQQYVAVSDHVKKEYTRQGFDSDRISIVPNSIDAKSYANEKKKSHEGINVLYVGRMSEEKGVNVLIGAFSKIAEANKNIHLILVGDGPALPEYRQLVDQYHIGDKVTFTGHLKESEVNYYYSIADVFVHPALLNEPFNVTLLEAMAWELPILVSNVGSLPQIVNDAGISFNKGDTNDLADKLTLLTNDEQMFLSLRSSCKTVLDSYTDEKVLKSLIELYNHSTADNPRLIADSFDHRAENIVSAK